MALPPTDPVQADLILDTNVLVDFVTIADLWRAGEEAGTAQAASESSDVEYRRQRARAATLFSWVCNTKSLTTGSALGEATEQILELVPPSEASEFRTVFTQLWVQLVRPLVLPDWAWGALTEIGDEVRGTRTDDLLLALAVREGTALVTNEGWTPSGYTNTKRKNKLNLRGKAKQCGHPVWSTEEYVAQQESNDEQLALAFYQALKIGIEAYWAEDGEDSGELRTALGYLDGLYRYVLFAETSIEPPR